MGKGDYMTIEELEAKVQLLEAKVKAYEEVEKRVQAIEDAEDIKDAHGIHL
jgi:hypothetical protein